MADTPPAQKITDDDIVAAIRNPETKPVMTASDIGDRLGVVDATIRGRMGPVLENYEEVQEAKIDRATVYWVEETEPSVSEGHGGRDFGNERAVTPEPEPSEEGESIEDPPTADFDNKSVPGVLLILAFGWLSLRGVCNLILSLSGRERLVGENGILDTSERTIHVVGTLAVAFTVGMLLAVTGVGLWMLLLALDMVGRGLWGAATGYFVGVACLVGLLYYQSTRAAEKAPQALEA